MRIVFFILVMSGLACTGIPGRTFAAEIPSDQGGAEQCDAHSEAGMRECLGKKAAESAVALKLAEDQASAALSKWDEDAKYATSALGKLRASSKAYARYREAQCDFASSLGGGAIGNALEIRRLKCVVALNTGRAQQLNANTVSLPSR